MQDVHQIHLLPDWTLWNGYLLYSAAGGFVFQYLEQTNEKQLCLEAENSYRPMEKTVIEDLWSMSKSFYTQYKNEENDPDIQANALENYRNTLIQFRDDVLELGYDGKNCSMMGEARWARIRMVIPRSSAILRDCHNNYWWVECDQYCITSDDLLCKTALDCRN